MFKREMKVNFKSFAIWSAILIGIFMVVYLIYPTIINSESGKQLDTIMQSFPPELLKAFNFDIASINSAFGWLKTEGFVFVILIIGIFASLLGSNILLKEESDKTIEYLHSLPVTRKKIVFSKVLCGIIYIVLITLILGIFNYIGLICSGDFDKKVFVMLSITPILSSIVIFSLSLFISTFFHKTKKMLGISLGLVFISYILQVLSTISESVEFLQYFSIFTLADTRNVIIDSSINPIMIIISLVLSIGFIALSLIRYEKKEMF